MGVVMVLDGIAQHVQHPKKVMGKGEGSNLNLPALMLEPFRKFQQCPCLRPQQEFHHRISLSF